MAFKFPLATLLRLREIHEQREERLLAQIQSQIAQGRQTLADLAQQRRGVLWQREQSLQRATSSIDLATSYAMVRSIDAMEAQGRDHLAKLLELRDQQMKIYQAAHQNCELLSEMRSNQRETFFKEQVKREQSVMDDNFLSRRAYE